MSFWVGVEDFDAACEKSRTAPSSGCSSSNPCEWDPAPPSRLECTPHPSLCRGRLKFSLMRRVRHRPSVLAALRPRRRWGCARKESPARKWGASPPIAPPERDRRGSPPGVVGVFRRRPTRAGMPARRFRQLGLPPLFIRVPPSERRSSALRLYSALSVQHSDTTRRTLSNSAGLEIPKPCVLPA